MGFAHTIPQMYLYNLKTDSHKTLWRSKHLFSFARGRAPSFPETDQHLPPVRTRSQCTRFLSSLCGACLCPLSAPSQSHSWVNLEPSLAFAEIWLFTRSGVLGMDGEEEEEGTVWEKIALDTGSAETEWLAVVRCWQATPAYENSAWPSFGYWSVVSVRYVSVETAGEWNSNVEKAKGGGTQFWLGFIGYQS